MNRLVRRIIVVIFILSALAYGGVRFLAGQDVDTGGPEITMASDEVVVSAELEPEAFTQAILKDVTAVDKKDGDVTASLIVERYTNFFDLENHKRQVTIDAFDNDGHVTKKTRTVVYSDYQSPQFVLSEPLRFPTSSSVDGLISHLSAVDMLDGDVTANISMTGAGGKTVYTAEGTYPVEIQVFNSAGDTSVLEATLEFYDASADAVTPKVLLSDYLVYIPVGSFFDARSYISGMELNYTEYDRAQMEEGVAPYGLSEVRVNDRTVNTRQPGTYEVAYSMKGSGTTASCINLIVVVR